jgi:muramoyltetrapeptide carboxypeptidase
MPGMAILNLVPPALRAGDLVALVAPSGPVGPDRVTSATDVLTGWGLRVRVGPHALNRHTFLAGTDDQRLSDLNAALRDPEVRGVLCLRGGYGLQRIVDDVDYAAVRADPKAVLGFSDITALHLGLWSAARLVTVHGPNAGRLDHDLEETARRALMTTEPIQVIADANEETFPVRVAGRAEGVLLGGNLTILAASAGTPHAPGPAGAVLLIEDVNEAPYRVDRALVQLGRAGLLTGLAGVAVGQFTGCGGPAVVDTLRDRLGRLGIPVLGGLPIGHGDHQVAVRLGTPVVLDATAGTLTERDRAADIG